MPPGIVMLAIAGVLIGLLLYALRIGLELDAVGMRYGYASAQYEAMLLQYDWLMWVVILAMFIVILVIMFIILGIISLVKAGKTHAIYKKQLAMVQKEANYFAAHRPNFDIDIGLGYRHFGVDKTQKVYFLTPSYKRPEFRVHNLDNIAEIRISENNNVVMDSMGNTTGAIVGGVLFGAAGAIIGSGGKNTRAQSMIDSLCINIVTNNIDDPHVQMEFLDYPVPRGSKEFEELTVNAQKVYSTLQSYITTKKGAEAKPAEAAPGLEERIRELTRLKEDGLISEQEFTDAKAKLLNA